MTKSVQEKLQRELAFKANMDPMGRKWGVGKVIGTALFHVNVVEGRKANPLPEIFQSKFTNPTLAQKNIEKYLEEMWDYAEGKQVKQERKEHSERSKERVEEEVSDESLPASE